MLRTLLALILALAVSAAGAQGIVNRPVAAGAISNPGTSLPSTCAVGYVYFKSNSTAGQNLHLCTAANTWTQMVASNLGDIGVATGNTLALTKTTAGDVFSATNGGATPKKAWIYTDAQYIAFGDTSGIAGTHLLIDVTNTTANIQVGNVLQTTWGASLMTQRKPLLLSTAATANQFRTTQTTAPTCSTNCGTSPSVIGSDIAGTITMGATGVPASGWVLTFNGTWPSGAPACVVQAALAGMAGTKMPTVIATTQTTITVTTNGAAPANGDKYHYHCIGIQ